MNVSKLTSKPVVVALALTFGSFAAPTVTNLNFGGLSAVGVAHAADSSDGKGKMQGGRADGIGHRGNGGAGGDIGGNPVGGGGRGQGGPSGDSDAKGPRYGGEGSKPAPGTQGGQPSWASQELTDIGRLNVARANPQVLERSLLNAVSELKTDEGYNVKFIDDAMAILTQPGATDEEKQTAMQALLRDPATVRIDSPLANLAFYKSILSTGMIKDADGNVVWSLSNPESQDLRDIAAGLFVGQAADKTKQVTDLTVHAVDVIMEFPSETGSTAPNPDDPTQVWNPDESQDKAVAGPAEIVRFAIDTVHAE